MVCAVWAAQTSVHVTWSLPSRAPTQLFWIVSAGRAESHRALAGIFGPISERDDINRAIVSMVREKKFPESQSESQSGDEVTLHLLLYVPP